MDDGKLVGAGWQVFRRTAVVADAPPAQLEEMRLAFFGGAQHLFESLMSFLEAREEPTEAGLERWMRLIHRELDEYDPAGGSDGEVR